jgi:DNA-binding transcriptional MerR regulator
LNVVRLGFDPEFRWQHLTGRRTIGDMTSELERDDGPAPPAVLTVAAVARRLGVAPPTLRTWDRRYGLGPSAHTAGSHRRYSPSDVSRLIVMRGLVMQGVPPAEAAQIALSTPVDGQRADTAPPRPTVAAEAARSPVWAAPRGRPGGRPEVGPGAASRERAGALGPAPVPASRGPLADGLPLVDGSPVVEGPPGAAGPALADSGIGSTPGGAGRGIWPVSPLAARHLLAAAEGIVALPQSPPAPGGGDDPSGSDGPDTDLDTDLDKASADAAGRDALLAGVIDAALRQPGLTAGQQSHLWPGPTGRAGGGRVISLPDASPRARGLARAAMSLDTHELGRLLRDAVGSYGVIGTWNTMVLPVLKGLGDRWEATGDGVDVEHAFTEATMGVLRGVTATLYRPRNVRPVLLTCAEGDHHSVPLHVLAAALSEVEIGCRMLGVGLPTASLVAAIRRIGPAVVLVYARLPVPDASCVLAFPRQRPAPRVLVGGPGWDGVDIPSHVGRVDSLQAAVDEVRAAVHL